MRYIKLFESFNYQTIINQVDDISAYLPVETTMVKSFWIKPNFDFSKSLSESKYKQYKGTDKYLFFRCYTFEFNEMSKVFSVGSDISNRVNSYGLKFFIINIKDRDFRCKAVFMTKTDWDKGDIEELRRVVEKSKCDLLFEEDIVINDNEFDVIYEDNDILAVKPKTYKAALKYAADTSWKSGLKSNKDWVDKYMTTGSYYGGSNWYKSTKVEKEVQTWWRKLLKLPAKKVQEEIKDFYKDFPRYLFYIVIVKRFPPNDEMSKIHLLYDVSRSEYGQLPYSNVGLDSFSYMLDAAHNQVKVEDVNGKRITFKDIHSRHGQLFNRAFREIESDFTVQKDRLYDLLGFWAEKGGEYRDDALIFIRGRDKRLSITKPSMLKVDKDGATWSKVGYYDDTSFDYWDDKESSDDKEVPNNGNGFIDFYKSMQNSIKSLRDSLSGDSEFKL